MAQSGSVCNLCDKHRYCRHYVIAYLIYLVPTGTMPPINAGYAFGNCRRPLSSLGVAQHMHKIKNLRKFGLNWSSKLQENNERNPPPPCCTELCRCLRRASYLKPFSNFKFCGKLPLALKLHYFKGGHKTVF